MRTAVHHAQDVQRTELLSLVPALDQLMTRAFGPGDDAVDAVQEVFSRALTALDELQPIRKSLGAFVHGIAMHVLSDVRRQRRRVREVHDVADTLLAHDADSLERLIRNEERTCVRQALRALAAGDQQLLRRCFIQGTLIADLARESGVPASRLRKRKSRAVRRLRLLLAPRLELVTTRIRHRV